MTDKLRAAAQAALEAWDTRAGISQASEAFEELRAALAEQDAEPVARESRSIPDAITDAWLAGGMEIGDAAPPRREWVGLTDEDIEAAWKACDPKRLLPSFASAVEAALREKNGG